MGLGTRLTKHHIPAITSTRESFPNNKTSITSYHAVIAQGLFSIGARANVAIHFRGLLTIPLPWFQVGLQVNIPTLPHGYSAGGTAHTRAQSETQQAPAHLSTVKPSNQKTCKFVRQNVYTGMLVRQTLQVGAPKLCTFVCQSLQVCAPKLCTFVCQNFLSLCVIKP